MQPKKGPTICIVLILNFYLLTNVWFYLFIYKLFCENNNCHLVVHNVLFLFAQVIFYSLC